MFWSPNNIAFALQVEGILSEEERKTIEDISENEVIKNKEDIYSSKSATELRRILSEKGYDGIVYQNMFEGDGESYIAFYPEQVIIIDDGKGGNNGGTVSSENSPLPEVSAENTETDMAQSLINDALGIENLSEGQKTLRKIGKAFGVEIGFKNLDEWRTDDNGKRYLFSPDGEYDPNTGKITLNTSKRVKHSPVAYILKHELTHSLEKNGVLYNDFADAVMESTAFKNYIKEKGFNTAAEYNADIVRQYTKKGVKNFDEGKADLEMVANFVGDMLFGGKTEITSKLLEGMEPKPKRSFTQWLKDALSYFKQKLTGQKVYVDEITQLEEKFLETVRSAQTKENTAQQDGGKSYSFNENFHQQLQDWLNGGGQKNGTYNGTYFELGTTPDVLTKHGAPYADIIMYSDVLAKVTGGKHSISLDEIAKLPAQLNDPILLFKGSVPNSFVALTEITDKNGNDVIVAVHINKRHSRTVVNKIASMYSKSDDFGNNKIIGYINSQISAGNLIDASNIKAPNWFTSRGLQLPKEVQTILGANNRVAQKPPVVNNNYMQETKKYSLPQTTDADSLLEQYESGEITREEYLEQLKGERTLNPVEIGRMTKEDASTTPPMSRKQGENEGDSESKTYQSLQKSDIFDEEFKDEVKNDEFIKQYQSITNKETLAKAARELDEGGQSYVNQWNNIEPERASLMDITVGMILMYRYQRVGDTQSAIAAAQKVRKMGTAGGHRKPVVVVAIVISVWNVVTDPTTKGIGDSAQALTYKKPNK